MDHTSSVPAVGLFPARQSPPHSHSDYNVACICPMGLELAPVGAMLDEVHPSLPSRRDQNSYTLGRLGEHNVVVVTMPQTGNNAAAAVATQLLNDFPSICFGLVVGIGGGVPGHDGEDDIRLGDIVVSQPRSTSSGVVQYDLGKIKVDGLFERTGTLAKPPAVLRTHVEQLKAQHRRKGSRVSQFLSQIREKYPLMAGQCTYPGAADDHLFQATYHHQGGSGCEDCDKSQLVLRRRRDSTDPQIHYGPIGSANVVIKDAATRERLKRDLNIICVDMESAGRSSIHNRVSDSIYLIESIVINAPVTIRNL